MLTPALCGGKMSDSDSITILLVEDEAQQREKLAAILEFVAQGRVIATDCDHIQECLAEEGIEAIILGTCGSSEATDNTFNTLQSHVQDIPILVLVQESEEKKLAKETLQKAFAMLKMPMIVPRFIDWASSVGTPV